MSYYGKCKSICCQTWLIFVWLPSRSISSNTYFPSTHFKTDIRCDFREESEWIFKVFYDLHVLSFKVFILSVEFNRKKWLAQQSACPLIHRSLVWAKLLKAWNKLFWCFSEVVFQELFSDFLLRHLLTRFYWFSKSFCWFGEFLWHSPMW